MLCSRLGIALATLLLLVLPSLPVSAQVFYAPPAIVAPPLTGLDPAFDLDMPGATRAEEQAALVWSLRQGLLLGALQCHSQYPALLTTDHYNALLTNHRQELAAAFQALNGYFRRTVKGMKPAQAALDQFVTRMTTRYSTVQSQPSFCHSAGMMGRRALFTPRGQLATLAWAHLAELRASLKVGQDQALKLMGAAGLVPTLSIPSMHKRCWSKKGFYKPQKCG